MLSVWKLLHLSNLSPIVRLRRNVIGPLQQPKAIVCFRWATLLAINPHENISHSLQTTGTLALDLAKPHFWLFQGGDAGSRWAASTTMDNVVECGTTSLDNFDIEVRKADILSGGHSFLKIKFVKHIILACCEDATRRPVDILRTWGHSIVEIGRVLARFVTRNLGEDRPTKAHVAPNILDAVDLATVQIAVVPSRHRHCSYFVRDDATTEKSLLGAET